MQQKKTPNSADTSLGEPEKAARQSIKKICFLFVSQLALWCSKNIESEHPNQQILTRGSSKNQLEQIQPRAKQQLRALSTLLTFCNCLATFEKFVKVGPRLFNFFQLCEKLQKVEKLTFANFLKVTKKEKTEKLTFADFLKVAKKLKLKKV